ncbi:MAG: transglycosylase SLT domain-containing protein [Kangiellaceae bacterium]|jgi:soluble lytic murein transglycosylase|nr:transglycosylase SLT domain-containing protein [Kangiellaceae bacterium]
MQLIRGLVFYIVAFALAGTTRAAELSDAKLTDTNQPETAQLANATSFLASPHISSSQLANTKDLAVVTPDVYQRVNGKLAQQRKQFKLAVAALRAGKVDKFHTLKDNLSDYPLIGYLEQAYILDRMSIKNRYLISGFLKTYGNEPVTVPVRQRFLKLLARYNKSSMFLQHYSKSSSTELQCHYLKFKSQSGQLSNEDKQLLKQVWLSGKSQPDNCDAVFAYMKNNQLLSQQLIWQRLVLAFNQRQLKLVRYLTSLLKDDFQSSGYIAQKILKDSAQIKRLTKSTYQSPIFNQLAEEFFSRHIWRKPEQALSLYQTVASKLNLTYQQKRKIANNFALALASSDHPEADQWMQNIEVTESNALLLRWKLAHELRSNNWQKVNRWVKQVVSPKGDEREWQYWLARSEQELGNTAIANQYYEELAKQRSYYGFLASAQLNKPSNLQAEDYQFEQSILSELSQQPRAVKVHELLQLGKTLSARREWNRLKSSLNLKHKQHLAALAHTWQWHEQVIILLAETGLYNAVNLRFPMAYSDIMQKASNKTNLDVSLSLAVARKESAFMPDAISRVGAIGLMQLMPQTAKYVANKVKLPAYYSEQLSQPETNVLLGSHYLKLLLEHYQGNTVLAAASYNAGRRKVTNWLPKDQALPADIWVEVVPYRETRAYIKSVLAYQQIYRRLMGQDQDVFKELVNMNISNNGYISSGMP